MNQRRNKTVLGRLFALATLLIGHGSTLACSVCYGDPDSNLTHGAFAGVMVLFGIIASVLAGIVATGVCWIRRSRNGGGVQE